MSMTYENMKIQFLPAGVVFNNFIKGIGSYSYEDYLVEFVNKSDYFLAKSGGELYVRPQREDNGECDCTTKRFQMDFKLVASKTKLQSKSLFSSQIHVGNGWTSYGAPKMEPGKQGYKPINATVLYAALRSANIWTLDSLQDKEKKQNRIENDLKYYLANLETDKNLFLFFPYNFFFDEDDDFDMGLKLAIQGIIQDFQESLRYRQQKLPHRDTYFSFLYAHHLILLEWNNEQLSYIEKHPIEESPLFIKLLRYSDEFDNGTLK